MKKELLVSLVVPVYNRIDKTKNLLDSIRNLDSRCEIIIVDDCSTDDIKSLVEECHPSLDIKYIRNQSNKGPSYSRNIGIKTAKNDFIAFTDNDCILSPSWIDNLYEYISNSPSSIAGVGGRTLSYRKNMLSEYYEYHKILDPWFHAGKCMYLVTANCIFRKSVLSKVGYFDENIVWAGGEDVGLSFKVVNEGFSLAYYPEAIVYHDFENSILNFYKTFFKYGFGCRIQYKKYFNEKMYQKPNFAGFYE